MEYFVQLLCCNDWSDLIGEIQFKNYFITIELHVVTDILHSLCNNILTKLHNGLLCAAFNICQNSNLMRSAFSRYMQLFYCLYILRLLWIISSVRKHIKNRLFSYLSDFASVSVFVSVSYLFLWSSLSWGPLLTFIYVVFLVLGTTVNVYFCGLPCLGDHC